MLFIIFKVQMISTQQVVQFHCLQIIRIYKQTINRSHGFHGRSPIFFLQCTKGQLISKAIYGLLTSPKKWMDEFVLFAFLLFTANKSKSSICFLGESFARHTMWDLCTIDWPKEDAANFESQNFEGP